MAYNPYQSPQSEIKPPSIAISNGNTLEDGIAGHYQFKIMDIMNEGLARSNGFKGTFWGVFIVYIFITLVVSLGSGIALGLAGLIDNILAAALVQLAHAAILTPMMAGIMILGARHADHQEINFKMMFEPYGKMIPLFLVYVLMALLVTFGFLLVIIPGIYLFVGYGFSLLLVAEKQIGVWKALESSRQAVHHYWFKFLGFLLILTLVNFGGLISIIGWIWTFPLSYCALGVLYRRVFGVTPAQA